MKKPQSKVTVFDFWEPLVNPVTLFSSGAWAHAFNFVLDYQKAHGQQMEGEAKEIPLVITFRDLYYSRWDCKDGAVNFQKAAKTFAKLGAKLDWHEPWHDNRPNEARVSIGGKELNAELYEYKGLTCFRLGLTQHLEGDVVKDNRFQEKPIQWQITMGQFMDFLETLEGVLMERSEPNLLRALMNVKLDSALISVSCHYQEPQPETWIQIHKQSTKELAAEDDDFAFLARSAGKLERKYILPQFKIFLGSNEALRPLANVSRLRYKEGGRPFSG